VTGVSGACWLRFADRASCAYDNRLADIRADTGLTAAETSACIAEIYLQLVTMLGAFEREWLRTMASRGATVVARERWPFMPRLAPDELR
jgi:hypothetical protein